VNWTKHAYHVVLLKPIITPVITTTHAACMLLPCVRGTNLIFILGLQVGSPIPSRMCIISPNVFQLHRLLGLPLTRITFTRCTSARVSLQPSCVFVSYLCLHMYHTLGLGFVSVKLLLTFQTLSFGVLLTVRYLVRWRLPFLFFWLPSLI